MKSINRWPRGIEIAFNFSEKCTVPCIRYDPPDWTVQTCACDSWNLVRHRAVWDRSTTSWTSCRVPLRLWTKKCSQRSKRTSNLEILLKKIQIHQYKTKECTNFPPLVNITKRTFHDTQVVYTHETFPNYLVAKFSASVRFRSILRLILRTETLHQLIWQINKKTSKHNKLK